MILFLSSTVLKMRQSRVSFSVNPRMCASLALKFFIVISSFPLSHTFNSTYNFAPHSHIIIHHLHFRIHVCHSFHSCFFRLEFAFPKINIYSVARMLYKQPLTLSKCVGFVCSCVPTIPLFSNPHLSYKFIQSIL